MTIKKHDYETPMYQSTTQGAPLRRMGIHNRAGHCVVCMNTSTRVKTYRAGHCVVHENKYAHENIQSRTLCGA